MSGNIILFLLSIPIFKNTTFYLLPLISCVHLYLFFPFTLLYVMILKLPLSNHVVYIEWELVVANNSG